jgi:hypothetical protein
MIGLYLAITMVWVWAVLVFAPGRHMRGIVLLPIIAPVAVALRWLSIGLKLTVQATDWVGDTWVGGWMYAFKRFDNWMADQKKVGV